MASGGRHPLHATARGHGSRRYPRHARMGAMLDTLAGLIDAVDEPLDMLDLMNATTAQHTQGFDEQETRTAVEEFWTLLDWSIGPTTGPAVEAFSDITDRDEAHRALDYARTRLD